MMKKKPDDSDPDTTNPETAQSPLMALSAAGGTSNNLLVDLAKSQLQNPATQQLILSGVLDLLKKLFGGLFSHNKQVVDTNRPPAIVVDTDGSETPLPDDKIVPKPKGPVSKGYTGLSLKVKGSQYNNGRFPNEYTDDNPNGMLPRDYIDKIFFQKVSNLPYQSKIWFDLSPYKGNHKVEHDEGDQDGILWNPVWHFESPGGSTVLRDGGDGPEGRIQILEKDDGSIGLGVTNWRSTSGWGVQVNCFEEGSYSVWAEVPALGLKTDNLTWTVS